MWSIIRGIQNYLKTLSQCFDKKEKYIQIVSTRDMLICQLATHIPVSLIFGVTNKIKALTCKRTQKQIIIFS